MQSYALEDRYTRETGRVFLGGLQALVRLPLMQRQMDRRRGLNTAGFITGYRGSPLAGYDQALRKAARLLDSHDIRFMPAVNENLAAAACLGSQQVETEGRAKVDGVFALWYGKGPGVDNAADALKHGNMYGSSPRGGVLVVAGDDHGGVSSTFPHQSDEALISFGMPVLHAADVAEYLSFGLYGWALSRYSGCWVGFKALSETVESSASIELPAWPHWNEPAFTPPASGLHNRWPDPPGSRDIETRLQYKHAAIRAFAAANPIDRTVLAPRTNALGIVTVGKAHLDTMDALAVLGIGAEQAQRFDIAVYKVGLTWPLEPGGLRRFAAGCRELLVIEEKRGVVEQQLRSILQDMTVSRGLRILGKQDELGVALVPDYQELRPHKLVEPLARRLTAHGVDVVNALQRALRRSESVEPPQWVKRTPYFCSGCPHNTSTRVPEGSRAYGGIGCHAMAAWMDRSTTHVIQMGGEGANWVGLAPFTHTRHVFQNLGDGTYFHSGILAIRQAVAARVSITYKILYNDAVAMTGGQPLDGSASAGDMVRQLQAEGVTRIAVVVDADDALSAALDLPADIQAQPRRELDAVQKELRTHEGVSALVYVQTCAAEKRRRRKRKEYPQPPRRVFINEAVCEGCGDCSAQSNCVSILPKPTPWGIKRQIDQSACNKDYSCIQGFCPSFAVVEGGIYRPGRSTHDAALLELIDALPPPAGGSDAGEILIAGIGGTGVVTLGALIGMAAHLQDKQATVLDFMGLAQKGGAVISHVKVAPVGGGRPVRIDRARADAIIACDLVAASGAEPLAATRTGHTQIVANLHEQVTGEFVLDRDAQVRGDQLVEKLHAACRMPVAGFDAHAATTTLCGDALFANIAMLGYAWQASLVPVSLEAMMRAIELNGVSIEQNKRAFAVGRIARALPQRLAALVSPDVPVAPMDAETTIRERSEFLTKYMDGNYAERYRELAHRVVRAERALGFRDDALGLAVARNLSRLMAYKDEYEVARLHAETGFAARISAQFEGKTRVSLYLAPPLLPLPKDGAGRPRKIRFGAWIFWLLHALAKLRRLRGTKLDPFGYTDERRKERALLATYREAIESVLKQLTSQNRQVALQIAQLPDAVRGYGPVKLAAIERFNARLPELLREFHAPAADASWQARKRA